MSSLVTGFCGAFHKGLDGIRSIARGKRQSCVTDGARDMRLIETRVLASPRVLAELWQPTQHEAQKCQQREERPLKPQLPLRHQAETPSSSTEPDSDGSDRSECEDVSPQHSLVVRALSGEVVLEGMVDASTPVSSIVRDVCERMGAHRDTVQLCSADGQIVKHTSQLGEQESPASGEAMELTLMRLNGPPITIEATSGAPIKLLDGVPGLGSSCHLDRSYKFLSLGDFAGKDRMRYVLTPNNDKMTPPGIVMWRLEVIVPVTVYLNFRSDRHVQHTGAVHWLSDGGWQLSDMKSTVSSGHPNGPYSGPVYKKAVGGGMVDLMGSYCDEGTYFVFVEVCM